MDRQTENNNVWEQQLHDEPNKYYMTKKQIDRLMDRCIDRQTDSNVWEQQLHDEPNIYSIRGKLNSIKKLNILS